MGGEGPKSKGKMGKESTGSGRGGADQQGSLRREMPRALEEGHAFCGRKLLTYKKQFQACQWTLVKTSSQPRESTLPCSWGNKAELHRPFPAAAFVVCRPRDPPSPAGLVTLHHLQPYHYTGDFDIQSLPL